MDSIFLLGAGGGIVIGAYFVYLATTKGLPAAIAWAKARWSGAKNDLAAVRGDLIVAQSRLEQLEADVAALQAATPAAPAPAAPAV